MTLLHPVETPPFSPIILVTRRHSSDSQDPYRRLHLFYNTSYTDALPQALLLPVQTPISLYIRMLT